MIRNLKPRASVSPEFIDCVKQVSRSYIKSIEDQIATSPYAKKTIIDREKVRLARHLQMLKDPTRLDLEITALRNLPFEKFEVVTIPEWKQNGSIAFRETSYLEGTTQEIVCKLEKNLSYNIGQYKICIPLPRLWVGTGTKDPQFIPLKGLWDHARFYHHSAANSFSAQERGAKFPEQMGGNTCWGSFDVNSTFNGGIPSEIFKILHQYLSVCNPHSTYNRSLSFQEKV